ncbi:MAG: nicotinate-nucleotide adenylyltransferase [Devosia sp.]
MALNRQSLHIHGVTELPVAMPGMRIGLFGGSFNPVHDGHRLVALQCLKRLRLDAVWLLVSPGNPLKDHSELAPLTERVNSARALMNNDKIQVTGFEAAHGFRYSFDTLRFLKETLGGTRFVWIMGADNLRQFHEWERWRDIAGLMPMAVYARPSSTLRATFSKAATALKAYRIPEEQAATIADRDPPAWVYLHGMMSRQSSTAIRASRNGAGTSN